MSEPRDMRSSWSRGCGRPWKLERQGNAVAFAVPAAWPWWSTVAATGGQHRGVINLGNPPCCSQDLATLFHTSQPLATAHGPAVPTISGGPSPLGWLLGPRCRAAGV